MSQSEEHELHPRVAERMQPVRGTIPTFATAQSARRRLEQETLRFLVVVVPGTGRLVGAVDREALARKSCCERLGGRCTVVQHLASDVAFCFDHESADQVMEAEAELAAEGRVPVVRRIPLLVVDADLKPVGCFPIAAPAEAASAIAPRAA